MAWRKLTDRDGCGKEGMFLPVVPRKGAPWSNSTGIVVHRHIDDPGRWLVSFAPLGIRAQPLGSAQLVLAQKQAILAVCDRLTAIREAVDHATRDL